eukprot:scaffold3511_cov92-Cylindrotheca_fusiformis.AAC.1
MTDDDDWTDQVQPSWTAAAAAARYLLLRNNLKKVMLLKVMEVASSSSGTSKKQNRISLELQSIAFKFEKQRPPA